MASAKTLRNIILATSIASSAFILAGEGRWHYEVGVRLTEGRFPLAPPGRTASEHLGYGVALAAIPIFLMDRYLKRAEEQKLCHYGK
jgi:hypothetical protein